VNEIAINEPLLQKTLDHITAHPEEHEQLVWVVRGPTCGTAGCAAGWAVTFAGHELRFAPVPIVSPSGWTEHAVRVSDGRTVEYAAREELGLTDEQASLLFSGGNTIHDLWRFAEEWTDGRVRREVGP
jgi:hypothetical protein